MIGFAILGPIDRSPLQFEAYFKITRNRIQGLTFLSTKATVIKSSWDKINITPSESMPMAGYKPRDHFETVHDSIYTRLLYLKIDTASIAIINIDLLIFPPLLKNAIEYKINASHANIFLYFSATHTHNSIGGWDNSLAGKFVSGVFHEEWIENTAEKIVKSITKQKQLKSTINYWESEASDLTVNRIAYDKGKEDGKIRGLQILREDSSKALLFSFSAHPTSVTKKSLALSADYPGQAIKLIEESFDFGMFLGGMVGSHSFENMGKENFELVELEGKLVDDKIINRKNFNKEDSISVSYASIPIEFGPSQLRISANWKVRDWVLSSLLGGLKGKLTYLRLGDIVMIGTPCDFSGEIFVRNGLGEFATNHNRHLMITSFNGNYVGYITYDGHYDSIKNAETREMNWVGPYYGEYFSTMIKGIIEKDTVTF